MTRRHALTINGWARRCDDCLPEEAMVKLLDCRSLPGGYEIWTVRAPSGRTVDLMAGYLEAVQSAYAP